MQLDFNAPNRAYAQYKNKPRFMAWLNSNKNILKQMVSNVSEIHKMYDTELSTGHMLDVLGAVVGFTRPNILIQDLESDNQFNRYEFGSAQFNAATVEAYKPMSDDMYRLLIKAKIFKNNALPTPDNIITAAKFITNVDAIVHEIKLAYYIEFQDSLSDNERYIFNNFDVLPRPQGVEFLRFEEKNRITEFGRNQFGLGSQFNT